MDSVNGTPPGFKPRFFRITHPGGEVEVQVSELNELTEALKPYFEHAETAPIAASAAWGFGRVSNNGVTVEELPTDTNERTS